MKNYSFDVEFKNQIEFKDCLEEIFRFIYGLNRKVVACYKMENKIKLRVSLNHYKSDELDPLESFKRYLKITGLSEKLKVSNVTCWEKVEDREKIYTSTMQAGGCLVFWLGCSFPFEFCEKLKMTVCAMPREDYRKTVKKYKL